MPFFTTKVIINSSFGVTLTHPVMAVRVVIRTFTKWQERFGARKQSPPYLSYRENEPCIQSDRLLIASALQSHRFERHFLYIHFVILSFFRYFSLSLYISLCIC